VLNVQRFENLLLQAVQVFGVLLAGVRHWPIKQLDHEVHQRRVVLGERVDELLRVAPVLRHLHLEGTLELGLEHFVVLVESLRQLLNRVLESTHVRQ
jgi:hypothetical protein